MITKEILIFDQDGKRLAGYALKCVVETISKTIDLYGLEFDVVSSNVDLENGMVVICGINQSNLTESKIAYRGIDFNKTEYFPNHLDDRDSFTRGKYKEKKDLTDYNKKPITVVDVIEELLEERCKKWVYIKYEVVA